MKTYKYYLYTSQSEIENNRELNRQNKTRKYIKKMKTIKMYNYELEFFNGNDSVLIFKSYGKNKNDAIDFALKWFNDAGENFPYFTKVKISSKEWAKTL